MEFAKNNSFGQVTHSVKSLIAVSRCVMHLEAAIFFAPKLSEIFFEGVCM